MPIEWLDYVQVKTKGAGEGSKRPTDSPAPEHQKAYWGACCKIFEISYLAERLAVTWEVAAADVGVWCGGNSDGCGKSQLAAAVT